MEAEKHILTCHCGKKFDEKDGKHEIFKNRIFTRCPQCSSVVFSRLKDEE